MKKIISKNKATLQDNFYHQVLESIDDYAVFTTDKKGIISSWNRGAEEIFGYTSKEVLGKPSSLIFTSQDREAHLPEKELMITIKKGKMVNEIYYIRKDASLFWASGLMFKLEDIHHKHTGFTKIVRDLTNKKAFDTRKDDFISTATHELRNPLTAIQLYANISENQARQVGNIPLINSIVELNNQIRRLVTLMDYLLDVSKIQKDKLVLEKTWFDLSKLVKATIKPIVMTSKNHTFVHNHTLSKKVFADRNRIGQVITNLVLNAVKYSPDGKKIITSISPDSQGLEFSIQDFGIGITKDEQSKIFTRFFRADITRQKKINGVGLGLYIAQKIIRSHGGRISMKSEKGVGSTFSFNLPAKV